MKEIKKEHFEMADSLTTALSKAGFKTQQVKETDLTDELVD